MKAYIINLEKSVKRRNHIVAEAKRSGLDYEIVDAVDGSSLTETVLEELCDMDVVRKYPEWLSPGMIGCVLSHKRAYSRFLATGATASMIIEDDAVLPLNLAQIAEQAVQFVEKDEIQLFFYSCFEPLELSSVNKTELGTGHNLLYPMTLNGVTGGVCYLIGRDAARALVEDNIPISLASDSWGDFISRGFVNRVRCLYPLTVDHLGVKSDINATLQTGIRALVTNTIEKYELPLLYRALQRKRQANISGRFHFSLTDEKSPIDRLDST